MTDPLVAIGMPVFDGAEHVGMAVGSLLEQTEGNFQLLISDDGSSDATPSICEELARQDPRIRFVRQERHLGMTGNFDLVLREATSPFFMWAAQDDLWAPEFLEEAVGLLEGDHGALAAMSAIEFIGPSGERIRTVRLPGQMADRDPVVRARSVGADGFHGIYALFRRERLLSTGVRLEDVPAPDVAFVFGLALHGRFVTTERVLSTRRVIGYSRVLTPEGRVVWEKALGPDGRLYDWARTDLSRAMWRHVRLAPVGPTVRARLGAAILRVWWSGAYRGLVERTGRLPVTHAWADGRYARACLLASGHVLLRPRRAYLEARRLLAERGARS